MRRILLWLVGVVPLLVWGQTYRLEGMVGGKYAIVMELEEFSDGLFSGRYAYKSILEKNGNFDSSWFNINPEYHNPATCWTVSDSKYNHVEDWYGIEFSDRKHLTAKLKNAQGKVYSVSATVTKYDKRQPSTIAYLKEHLGDSPSEFLFSDPSLVPRFEEMMGAPSFEYMVSIYQVQGGVEYTNGMYWGSAFQAHMCCDPYVIWAYDADENAFYVYILKDGQNYWWSESGSIPSKFQQLVMSKGY